MRERHSDRQRPRHSPGAEDAQNSDSSASDSEGPAESSTGAKEPSESSARQSGREQRRHRHHMRKERILHTRISEQLSEDIREVADELRVPVSNLVRNVLEEAFTVAERVRDDMGGLLDEVMDEAEKASARYVQFRQRRRARDAERESRGDDVAVESESQRGTGTAAADTGAPGASLSSEFPEVIAWQPVVLNTARRCARSGEEIAAGQRAYLGLGESGPTGVLVRSLESDLPD